MTVAEGSTITQSITISHLSNTPASRKLPAIVSVLRAVSMALSAESPLESAVT